VIANRDGDTRDDALFMAKSLRDDSYAIVSFSGLHISYWDLAKLIDRRRSAPRQLEDEKKLESGRDGACQIRAGQVGAGSSERDRARSEQCRQLNLAWLASADSFARFAPHCHLLNGCRYLMSRFPVPVLTPQPPVLQNNRKVPDAPYNCRGSLPNFRQPSGINRPKACYLLNFAKNSLFTG
jgi:hypothetical protein